MATSKEISNRSLLGTITGMVALSSSGGGIYGMVGAKDVPLVWLEDSLFPNYFVPSLILFIVVGGFSLVASIFVIREHPYARRIAYLDGIIILAWIVFQVKIIGYVSWMQPFIAIAGFSILFLSRWLPKAITNTIR
ncbi:MAG: hypothetical protein ABI288_03700 [Ginsengibacter sp.]